MASLGTVPSRSIADAKSEPAGGAVLGAQEAPQKRPSETLVRAMVSPVLYLRDLVTGHRERSIARALRSIALDY